MKEENDLLIDDISLLIENGQSFLEDFLKNFKGVKIYSLKDELLKRKYKISPNYYSEAKNVLFVFYEERIIKIEIAVDGFFRFIFIDLKENTIAMKDFSENPWLQSFAEKVKNSFINFLNGKKLSEGFLSFSTESQKNYCFDLLKEIKTLEDFKNYEKIKSSLLC